MDAHPTSLLIDPALIWSSLYDLAAVLYASEGLARQSTEGGGDEFDRLRVRHEVAQATKLLIEAAVVMRNLLDGEQWPRDVVHQMRIEKRPEREVGLLVWATGKEAALSFRDACNKVIHAQRVSFGMKELPGKTRHLDGTVELHGSLNQRNWVAKVDLSDFIRMAVRQL